jgi:hypothetical protein
LEALARDWMLDREQGRVQGWPRSPAGIRQRLSVQRSIVDAFSAERRAQFPEVNAHLMCAAGFQAAFHEREITEGFDDADMCDGALTMSRLRAAATPAVTAVWNQEALDPACLGLAADQGQISALDAVAAKLLAEVALGLHGSCQNDEPAGVPVKPVYGTDTFTATQLEFAGEQVHEGRRQKTLATLAKLCGLMGMTYRGQTGRLVHDDDVGVGKDNLGNEG